MCFPSNCYPSTLKKSAKSALPLETFLVDQFLPVCHPRPRISPKNRHDVGFPAHTKRKKILDPPNRILDSVKYYIKTEALASLTDSIRYQTSKLLPEVL